LGLEDIRFPSLPETRREVDRLLAIWDRAQKSSAAGAASEARLGSALALRGTEAAEEAVKRLASHYRVLHLATHGFFIGESCVTAGAEDARGVGTLTPASAATAGSAATAASAATPGPAPSRGQSAQVLATLTLSPSSRYVGSPLRLSGLALAGANRRGQVGPETEDGILTAEEIAALDLGGVEWAVLSACDTGMGEVVSGGDVMGLRRAFRMAGARTVLMSLAPVKDEVALEWMEALYRARFLEGLDTAHSVRSASRSLLESRRHRGASTHPFYWAGFLATGDWR
jgi:CHAT domain-containing protein